MAKRFEVKVYNKSGTYLTTWGEVVSNITFNNEINTAGGSMSFSLARNAGDYGEGSDIDFGFKVVVWVFDKEEPYGKIIFQGYISAYTPIYKDNKVDVTVLSYGAELTDYIIEAGEILDQSQLVNSGYWAFGNGGSPSNTIRLAQTFTATSTNKWNRLETYMKTNDEYIQATGLYRERTNIGCKIYVYAGNNPSAPGALLGESNTAIIAGRTEQLASFTFTPAIEFTNGSTYTFVFTPSVYAGSSDQYTLNVRYGSGYTGGALWYEYVP